MRASSTNPYPWRRLVPLVLLLSACTSPRVASVERILAEAQPEWEHGASTVAAPPAAARGASTTQGLERPGSEWSLPSILARIAQANPTLGRAQAQIEQARAAKQEAIAAYYPELSLGLDYVATDNPAQAFALLLNQQDLSLGAGFDPTPGSIENWRKELRLDWPLFAPGRKEFRQAAREGEEAARLAGEAIERRLLNAGVQAWLGLRAARELEEVAVESVVVVERRLEQTRRRQSEGAALKADVLRLEARLAATRQEAARAVGAVHQAESSLNSLMGRAPDQALVLLEEEVEIGSSLPSELPALFAEAQAGRRDLMAAAHALRRVGYESAAARADRSPSLHAFAAYDIDGDDPGIDTDLDSYILGVGLRFPLSARTGARIEGRVARERQARAGLRELSLSITHEVQGAWNQLTVARESLGFAEASAGAAEEAFRLLAAAQDAGGATVTDVLEAENARKGARVRLVAARAGVQIARAKLVASTGGIQ